MRHWLSTLSAAALLTLAFGCKKEEKKAETTPEEAPAEAPAHAAPAEPEKPAEPPSGETGLLNKMVNCPSAVLGAKTEVSQGDGVVLVTITADGGEEVAKEIQTRAKHLAGIRVDAEDVKHTGEGHGGGTLGKCPVVMTDVVVSTEDIENGAKISLKPKDPGKVGDLLKEATARAEALEASKGLPAGGHGSGTGGGLPGHDEETM